MLKSHILQVKHMRTCLRPLVDPGTGTLKAQSPNFSLLLIEISDRIRTPSRVAPGEVFRGIIAKHRILRGRAGMSTSEFRIPSFDHDYSRRIPRPTRARARMTQSGISYCFLFHAESS